MRRPLLGCIFDRGVLSMLTFRRDEAGVCCLCRLQKPDVAADTGDAPLRYTARSSGNCLDFNFPRQPRTTQTPSASPGAPPTQAPKR